MPVDLQETRMPGVGVKYTLRLHDGGRIAVILHNDGTREGVLVRTRARRRAARGNQPRRRRGPPARRCARGAYERPKIVDDLEMALGELQIEWIPVPDTSPWIGKTLAEAAFRALTGVTIIAILREPEPVTVAASGRREDGRHARHGRQGGAYPMFRRSLAGQD